MRKTNTFRFLIYEKNSSQNYRNQPLKPFTLSKKKRTKNSRIPVSPVHEKKFKFLSSNNDMARVFESANFEFLLNQSRKSLLNTKISFRSSWYFSKNLFSLSKIRMR